MVASKQDKAQVEALIQEWRAAFVANDPDKLKNLWDKDYPQLIYVAEEDTNAHRGFAAISKYYDNIRELVRSANWTIKETTVDVIGGMAYAYVEFLVKADIKGIDHPMTFDGRDTFILRKRAERWKIIHYHESLSRDHSRETWGFLWK